MLFGFENGEGAGLTLGSGDGLCTMVHILNDLSRINKMICSPSFHPPPLFAVFLERPVLLAVELAVADFEESVGDCLVTKKWGVGNELTV